MPQHRQSARSAARRTCRQQRQPCDQRPDDESEGQASAPGSSPPPQMLVIIAVTKSTSRSASIRQRDHRCRKQHRRQERPDDGADSPGSPSLPESTARRCTKTVPARKRLEAQKQRQQQPNLVDPDPEDEHHHEGHPAELPLALVEHLAPARPCGSPARPSCTPSADFVQARQRQMARAAGKPMASGMIIHGDPIRDQRKPRMSQPSQHIDATKKQPKSGTRPEIAPSILQARAHVIQRELPDMRRADRIVSHQFPCLVGHDVLPHSPSNQCAIVPNRACFDNDPDQQSGMSRSRIGILLYRYQQHMTHSRAAWPDGLEKS
jgi:hypothetical protein